MVDKIFAFSLMAGFLWTLSIFLTTGKLRILRTKRWRFLRRTKRIKTQTAWAGPLFIGMFLTLFGSSGLLVRVLLRTAEPYSFALAVVAGASCAGAGVWLLKRYFAVTANEVTGNPLTGMIGRVSLAIPAGGVGTVACNWDGRRMMIPARDRSGLGVPKGSRVIVIDILDRIALVQEI